jgi:hypothetical protein
MGVFYSAMSAYDDFSDYQGEPVDETDDDWSRSDGPGSDWQRWVWLGVFAADIGCLIWLCAMSL